LKTTTLSSTYQKKQSMEMNSTINNKWRFCTFASFIGCIILLFCLNQGQERVKLSTLGNVGEPMALYNDSDQHSAANIQLLQPSNTIEYGKEINVEEVVDDGCNIFDGKWVYDPMTSPLYNGSVCPFLSDQVSCQRNGRPDVEYQKWSWEAKGCKIPR
jgi:hypothetical protein